MSPLRGAQFAIAVIAFAVLPLHAAPDTAKLRDQLKLATKDGDTLSRIELLRRILDADPSDAKSQKLLIALWLNIEDYDMAEAALNAWPAAPPATVALTRAQILRNRDKDFPGAVKLLNDYLAKFPRDTAAWESLVVSLQKTDDPAALLKALDAYIALDSRAENLIRRANVKLALGDYTGAIADAKTAQATEPATDIVKSSMPQFERLEETLQALPPLDAALQKDPKNIAALLDRAWWLRYGGINDRSLTDAEAALAIVPASDMARISKYRALYLLDRVKSWEVRDKEKIDVLKSLALETAQAITTSDLALAKNPDDAAELTKRAFSLNDAEQYLLAQQDVEHALSLDPKSAKAALEGIFALTMLGADPTSFFRRLEQMKPEKSQLALANGYLAEMYFRQANFPLALEFADRSLALEETERILRVKSSTLQRLDRGPEANEALSRAEALRKKK